MGSEESTLGDLIDATGGSIQTGPFGTKLKASEYTETGVPVISVGEVGFGRIRLHKKTPKVDNTIWERMPEYLLKTDDIVFGRKGAVERSAHIQPNEDGYFLGSDGIRVRLNPDESDPRFIAYQFQSELHKVWMIQHAAGTTMPSLNEGIIRRIPITLPPLSEQKAIAHILGSLDDKIELNRRMNATLEGMAQALFKSWFVDFDPVIDNALAAGNPIPDELAPRAEVRRQALANGTANREAAKPFPAAFQPTEELGWIPEGWQAAKLSDLLEVKYGKDHKKLNEGSIPVYGSGGLMRHADKSLYSGESVLIPRKGTLSNILYLNEEFWTVDTMFYTIPKHEHAPKYTFYHLKGLDFTSMNVGSAVPSMTTKVLNELPIVMPDDISLKYFDGILATYFDKSEANNKQLQTLTKLRDTLLPKLISGELSVAAAQSQTEEATHA